MKQHLPPDEHRQSRRNLLHAPRSVLHSSEQYFLRSMVHHWDVPMLHSGFVSPRLSLIDRSIARSECFWVTRNESSTFSLHRSTSSRRASSSPSRSTTPRRSRRQLSKCADPCQRVSEEEMNGLRRRTFDDDDDDDDVQ